MTGDLRHLRNAVTAMVVVAAALTLVVLQLPVTAGVQPDADPAAMVVPHRRWAATPPRLAPTAPTAVAMEASPPPRP
ncbi:hypothetical protein B7486_72095, partial [cyanobacterium TDX16]